jgi:RNA polymerase sigma-70 factor (ECF subfamily)
METAPAQGTPPASRPPEEREWVERAARGDEAAFRALVDRHRDRAFALALRIVRSRDDAAEVAQDAFVRAWRALPAFRGEAAFGTWLHRIVTRVAFDRARVLSRRRAREADLEAAGDIAGGEGPPDPRQRSQAARLERLVAGLTEAQRTVVTLFYHQDRSVEDVAHILRMPENTVKTHLSRARAALRAAWLEDEGP